MVIAHIHPEDRARVDASIHAAIDLRVADSWTDEYRFLRADGTYAEVLDRGHIIRSPDGRATRMIGAMLDLTRRRTEAALQESEERLRLAVENAEIGFWDVDVVNDMLIWPSRTKAMFGISANVPVTMTDFYEGLHPEDREATSAVYAAAADPQRRALYDVEYRTIGKEDGIIRWVAAKGRGIFDHSNRCVRVLGTAIDVSERKRVEQALRDLNETLERRVAEAIAEGKLLADLVEGTDAFVQVVSTNFGGSVSTGLPATNLNASMASAARRGVDAGRLGRVGQNIGRLSKPSGAEHSQARSSPRSASLAIRAWRGEPTR